MITLEASSEECKSVLLHFPQHGNYDIIEVQRIVNQSLHGRYISVQEELYRSSPSRGTERLLFFGTDKQTYPKINAHGFHTDFQKSGMCSSPNRSLVIMFIFIQFLFHMEKDSISSEVKHMQLRPYHQMIVASIMFTLLVF